MQNEKPGCYSPALLCQRNNKDFNNEFFNHDIKIMAPSGNVDSVFTYFFETRRRLLSKKELPEGIYNYEATRSGIQIIVELISGLFDTVHKLSMDGYAYQSDDV